MNDSASPAVEVAGIPRDALTSLAAAGAATVAWSHLFAVYAVQPVAPGSAPPATPPVAGTWKIAGARLRFEPRFSFVRDVTYRAEFWPSRLRPAAFGPGHLLPPSPGGAPQGLGPVISFFELPRDNAAPATIVLQIYPSSAVLPENQLKFYVHFSGPMSRGGIYEHVQLRDSSGTIIELPFLELDEELWDPAMTRLTLLIDPGRIKRGVKPLEDIGPVFEAGNVYTLAIMPAWRDAAGRPLQRGYEKSFRVGAADRSPPDPARWTLQSVPAAGTKAPLVVQFDEPLDRALAMRLIGVSRVDANGTGLLPLDGEIVVDEQERRWMLRPSGRWRAGAYRLIVATTIEDLAGNNIGKTFDVELAGGAQRQLAAPSVTVPFDVK